MKNFIEVTQNGVKHLYNVNAIFNVVPYDEKCKVALLASTFLKPNAGRYEYERVVDQSYEEVVELIRKSVE